MWYNAGMKRKSRYNVLAVYSLRHAAGREHFSGVLDEMSNTSDWRLDAIRPELFASGSGLLDEDGRAYDGIILSMSVSDEEMERIAKARCPAVLVDIPHRGLSARCDAISFVWTDNADIGRRAARHLVERGGFKAAGYVHDPGIPFYSLERMMSYRQTMKRAGLETSVFGGDGEGGDASGGLAEWLRALPRPAAVMAATDVRAADVINACRDEGIPVPSQVSVIGVDYDVSQHARCGMSISSVVQNSRQMGRRAVRELDFLLRHPKWKGRPHEVLIPAKEVFAGESTSRSVSAMRLASIARKFISENCGRALSTDDVVEHIGCSRRLADMKFREVFGTTIHKAIADARMDEARRRILRGESVGSVVRAMRFTSANQLYQTYKRHFGHTIRQTFSDKAESRSYIPCHG